MRATQNRKVWDYLQEHEIITNYEMFEKFNICHAPLRIRDITYCTRNCANYKCRRNKKSLEPSECNYAYYGAFEACEEFIKKEKI